MSSAADTPAADLQARLGGICVVLGAGGTLGSALTHAFTNAGAEVVGADMRESPGVIPCDITDGSAVAELFDSTARQGEIRYVVHAVGRTSVSEVAEADISAVRDLLDVNLVSCFITAKCALRWLSAGHSLTFVASHAALYGAARWAAYCASKAGVVSLTQALSQEVGPRRVRVNCVSPGSVESPMMNTVLAQAAADQGRDISEVRRDAQAASPLGRFAAAEEIASVCVFLASPDASYITGANIVVNGGERPG